MEVKECGYVLSIVELNMVLGEGYLEENEIVNKWWKDNIKLVEVVKKESEEGLDILFDRDIFDLKIVDRLGCEVGFIEVDYSDKVREYIEEKYSNGREFELDILDSRRVLVIWE